MKHILTCVDLFCGAGGLSKGFLDAGYDVVLGVDYDDAALETFRKNHGHATAMKLDLYNHENLDQIVKFLDEKGIRNLEEKFSISCNGQTDGAFETQGGAFRKCFSNDRG